MLVSPDTAIGEFSLHQPQEQLNMQIVKILEWEGLNIAEKNPYDVGMKKK